VPGSWVETNFVGRRRELTHFEEFLNGDDLGHRVLLVNGPGGIGKTCLLDAFAERACGVGWAVHAWTAEQIAEFDVDVEELGEVAAQPGRHLLLVDGCDDRAAIWRQLRVRVGSRLSASNRLVVASRLAPQLTWHTAGWDRAADSLALGGLSDLDADELVLRRGLTVEPDRRRVVDWAEGHPLALALAADLVRAEKPGAVPFERDSDVAAVVIDHVVGSRAGATADRVLATAAMASDPDGPALAAALPDVDPEWAESWLRGQSFVRPYGSRLRVHDSVRGLIASAYEAADPDAALLIRRALADHYLRRGLDGEPRALIDLSGLVHDPALRHGLGQEEGRQTQASAARPEEFDELMELSAYSPHAREGVRRWFEEAPEHIVVARGPRGELVGWVLAATLRRHPDWVAEDPVLGPWIEHARERHPDGDAFFPRDLVDLGNTAAPVPATIAWGHAWFVRRLGISGERYCYAAAHESPAPAAMHGEWLRATGHVRIPQLTVGSGPDATHCWFVDHGRGGLAALIWRLVYADLGLTAPAGLPILGADLAVREALRNLHDAGALARSPMARGSGVAQRAAYVRRSLDAAIEAAFGSAERDVELRRVLEVTYFEPSGGAGARARQLALSRATYYRRLDEAIRRVADRLGG